MTSNFKESAQEEINQAYEAAQATFNTGRTRTSGFRKAQLTQLGLLVQENEPAFLAALSSDLGRPDFETIVAEFNPVKAEINDALKKLEKWMKPAKVETAGLWNFAGARVRSEPKGVALIIGAWNYPISLLFGPLVGAIAAGCCAVLKPSELCPTTAAIIASLVPLYLDTEAFHVINGGITPTSALLKLKWNHIFYTGSGNVGKVIARAAAEHLTPVTLELGGKSPAIVLDDADVLVTARRLMWGKWINCGQTCVSPDYILCSAEMQDRLVDAFTIIYAEFNAEAKGGAKDTQRKMSRIINSRHLERVQDLLERSKGEIVVGGGGDGEELGVTILKNVGESDALMEGEIFGPVLPILVKPNMDAMISLINSKDIPLALYVFTSKTSSREYIFSRTRSGGFVQNDVIVQFAIDGLPFGGAGESGYGSYHGKKSFDTFSHERAFASVPYWFEVLLASRYPPYNAAKLRMLLLATKATIAKPSEGGFLRLGNVLKLMAVLFAAVALVKGASPDFGRKLIGL